LGFLLRPWQLIFRNGGRKFLKEKIARIQNEDILLALPLFLDPRRSLGQTAKPILLVSGGTRIDLAVDIVAVEEVEGFAGFLSIGGMALSYQENPQDENHHEKPFCFHSIHLIR
jgi:hypothetical protein